MGRTKVFDETIAIDRAMRLFWRQGYANTSIKQLLDEMQMLNGSFYHSFKDKQTIFLESLKHYDQLIGNQRLTALSAHENFSLGIRAVFDMIFKTFDSKAEPNGCLITNSFSNDVLCINELKIYLNKSLSDSIELLTERIQYSKNLKLINTHVPAQQLAFIIITYMQGLFMLSNSSIDSRQLKSQTSDFLSSLNL